MVENNSLFNNLKKKITIHQFSIQKFKILFFLCLFVSSPCELGKSYRVVWMRNTLYDYRGLQASTGYAYNYAKKCTWHFCSNSLWIPSKGFQKASRWHQPLPRFSQMSDGLLRWPVSWLSHIFETAFSEKKIGINCVQWWWWNWRPAVTQGSKMTLFSILLQFHNLEEGMEY